MRLHGSVRDRLRLGGGIPQYFNQVKALFGANSIAHWELSEIIGSIAHDFSGNNFNAAIAGSISLGAGLSPTKKPCMYFSGSNGQVISLNEVAPFLSSISFDEGAFYIQYKPTVEVLTDTTNRGIFVMRNTPNLITTKIDKGTAPYQFTTSRHNGSAYDPWAAVGGISSAVWHDILITWSKTTSLFYSFVDGYLMASGALGTSKSERPDGFVIGALGTTGAIKGYLANAGYVNRRVAAAEALSMHNICSPAIKTISFIGDSISTDMNGWDKHLSHNYLDGRIKPINHAVGGHSIMTNLDSQVLAAANDNADIIFIEMGTNDNNAGNMTALQAEAEENILELQTSNPRASIFWINVLKTWTDGTFATESDKSNIRAAISAACTAKGITCIDTYSSPWLLTTDMADKTHPNAGGYYKMYTNIFAFL